jgi:hypothetical protein
MYKTIEFLPALAALPFMPSVAVLLTQVVPVIEAGAAALTPVLQLVLHRAPEYISE